MDLNSFQSDRLNFRPFCENDLGDLVSILSNKQVCEYLPGENPYTHEQVSRVLNYFIKTFIIDKKNLHFICSLKGTNTVVGYAGCSYIIEYDCNEIEYFLKPDYFGNGYASEMAFEMKKVAIELGLTHLVGLAHIDNIPSQKILEKIGYEFKNNVEHWNCPLKYYELNI